MMDAKRIASLVVVTGLLMAGSSSAWAQQAGRQQQRMSQQMNQMQRTMQRIDRVMQRTNRMSQNMNRYMEQAQGEQLRHRIRMTQRLGDEFGSMARTLKGAAERTQTMLQDGEMLRDREMNRDMKRLREHVHQMSSQVEDAVQTMERVTDRLRRQVGGSVN